MEVYRFLRSGETSPPHLLRKERGDSTVSSIMKRNGVSFNHQSKGCHIAVNKHKKREYNVIVERDEEGYYVASVPELPVCYTQAGSLDKLMERIREAIELCVEVQQEAPRVTQFVGFHLIRV